MSTLTGKYLNLVKPALTDDYKVTIGTDLPANFQKIDDEFSAHLAENASDAIRPHGLGKIAKEDYEEGIWTPALNRTGIVYEKQTGRYIKIGKMVFIEGYIKLSSAGTGSLGTALLGVPFPISIVSGNYVNSINIVARLLTTPALIHGEPETSTSISIKRSLQGDYLPIGDIQDSTSFIITGMYKTI